MKSSTKKIARISLILSAILCVALIATQFIPHWTYNYFTDDMEEATDTISIMEYMALTYQKDDVTYSLKDASKDFNINNLASTFCIVVLLGIVAIAFIIIKPKSLWVSVWPTAVGVGSLVGYLTEPLWKIGSNYTLLLILSAALAVTSLVAAVIWLSSFRFWFMDPKKIANK